MLADPTPKRWIKGRLLDPRGRPVRGAALRSGTGPPSTIRGVDPYSWRNVETDDAGEFSAALNEPGPIWIFVPAHEWEWDDILLRDVEPGTRDLELSFRESSWTWVNVRDAEGAVVTKGRVVGVSPKRPVTPSFHSDRAVSEIWSDGRARLHIPREVVEVRVFAPGFEIARLGPFEPAAIPNPLEVVLTRER